MDHVWLWVRYLQEHPSTMVWVAVIGGAFYWLLNRKPKLQREADKRMEEIREERGDPYNKMRPLR